jgi:hypothetical protein
MNSDAILAKVTPLIAKAQQLKSQLQYSSAIDYIKKAGNLLINAAKLEQDKAKKAKYISLADTCIGLGKEFRKKVAELQIKSPAKKLPTTSKSAILNSLSIIHMYDALSIKYEGLGSYEAAYQAKLQSVEELIKFSKDCIFFIRPRKERSRSKRKN